MILTGAPTPSHCTVNEQHQMRAALKRWVQMGRPLHGGPPPNTASWSIAELVAGAPACSSHPLRYGSDFVTGRNAPDDGDLPAEPHED